MKNITAILIFLFGSVFACAQNTVSITGCVTDAETEWSYARVTATLINPFGTGTPVYMSGGQVPNKLNYSLDYEGCFQSATIPNNANILPPQTSWSFSVKPFGSAPAQVVGNLYVSGAINLGNYISSLIQVIRISASDKNLIAYVQPEILNPVNGTSFIQIGAGTTYAILVYRDGVGWTQPTNISPAPPDGPAGGDLSGFYPDPIVAQVNNSAIPNSSSYVGTNAMKQFIAATTPLLPVNNLSDLANTATARSNLGLGTMAIQSATSVSISGGHFIGYLYFNYNCDNINPVFTPPDGGLTFCWNYSGGNGDSDIIFAQGAGGTGGLNLYSWNGTALTLAAQLSNAGIWTFNNTAYANCSALNTVGNVVGCASALTNGTYADANATVIGGSIVSIGGINPATVSTTVTLGTGVTSATCVSSSCNANRGEFSVVFGAFTGGRIFTFNTGVTQTSNPICVVTGNGIATYPALGYTTSTTGVIINGGASLASTTALIDYRCTL